MKIRNKMVVFFNRKLSEYHAWSFRCLKHQISRYYGASIQCRFALQSKVDEYIDALHMDLARFIIKQQTPEVCYFANV